MPPTPPRRHRNFDYQAINADIDNGTVVVHYSGKTFGDWRGSLLDFGFISERQNKMYVMTPERMIEKSWTMDQVIE